MRIFIFVIKRLVVKKMGVGGGEWWGRKYVEGIQTKWRRRKKKIENYTLSLCIFNDTLIGKLEHWIKRFGLQKEKWTVKLLFPSHFTLILIIISIIINIGVNNNGASNDKKLIFFFLRIDICWTIYNRLLRSTELSSFARCFAKIWRPNYH